MTLTTRTGTIAVVTTVTRHRAGGAADGSKTIHDRASTAPPATGGFFCLWAFLVLAGAPPTTCTSDLRSLGRDGDGCLLSEEQYGL